MQQKNLLKLHEAMVIALTSLPDRKGTFDEVAAFIRKRKLFENRKWNISLAKQIMLRSLQSKHRYSDLFEKITDEMIKLRNI